MQVHIKIYGRVQGVFFRSQAKAVADDLGLTGWVRNNPNGLVEAMAEGSKEKLDQFVEWCKKGPRLAHVERVEVDWSKKEEGLTDFEIISD